jgi:hypothetical protein
MIKKKLPIVSLILYILAGLFLIFAIWAAVFSFQYISSVVEMEQLVIRDNLFEVTSFHVANFGQYVVFAALLFGAGWIGHIILTPYTEDLDVEEEEFEVIDTPEEDFEVDLDDE